MDGKIAQFLNKGMRQDLSIDKVSNEYAFENVNIRITEADDHTLLSVTNELGNDYIEVLNETDDVSTRIVPTGTDKKEMIVDADLIGACQIEDYLVLFFARDTSIIFYPEGTKDSLIIKMYVDRTSDDSPVIKWRILYEGNLGFNIQHPIETLGDYESENVIKVYWVDGEHQPRMINIMADPSEENYTDTSFDFLPVINSFATLVVDRMNNTSGRFPSGVIQYALSYSNIYGQESAVFYTSDIQYIMFSDRAGGPDEIIDCAFELTIGNIDTTFDRINIYSIYRASYNGTPVCKKVTSLSTSDVVGNSIVYVDYNNTGEIIDNTELFYKGGDFVIAGTLDQKDSVLFMGDLKINRTKCETTANDLDYEIRTIRNKQLPSYHTQSYFPYSQEGSNYYKYLKYGEYYRIGIQLQDKYGKWSDPIFLEDYQQDEYRPYNGLIPETYIHITHLVDSNIDSIYKRARAVIVYPRNNDRSCCAQGVVNSTVFRLKDRYNNAPYAQASWFFRPIPSSDNKSNDEFIEYRHCKLLKNNSTIYGEIASQDNLSSVAQTASHNSTDQYNFIRNYAIIGNNAGGTLTYLPLNDSVSSGYGYVGIGFTLESPYERQTISESNMAIHSFGVTSNPHFAVDANIVTLNSPELDNITDKMLNYKFKIVGIIPITKSYSLYNVTTETSPEISSPSGFWNAIGKDCRHRAAYAQWIDLALYHMGTQQAFDSLAFRIAYPLYTWQKEGVLTGNNVDTTNNGGLLGRQILSNTLYSEDTLYLSGQDEYTYEEASKVYVYDPANDGLIFIDYDDPYTVINHSVVKDGSFSYYGGCNTIATPIYQSYMTYAYGALSNNGNFRCLDTYNNVISNNDGILTQMNRIAIRKSDATPVYLYDPDGVELPREVWPSSYYIKYPTTDTPTYSTSPVNIKYKSTKHAVLSLGFTQTSPSESTPGNGGAFVLPYADVIDSMYTDNSNFGFYGYGSSAIGYPYWMRESAYSTSGHITRLSEYMLDESHIQHIPSNKDILFVGELYKDVDTSSLFGGTSEYALSQNNWLPASEPVSLVESQDIYLSLIGDTMYQRWDCLKTYAYTNEDTASITETLSFMVESQINLDGRYDRNRGRTDNTSSSPTNVNLFNDVYNQENNYFNYRIFDDLYYQNNSFPNQFVWSLPKQPNAEIDNWSNIILSSVYNVDGSLGKINKIKMFNDTLFGFQDKGIFQILFNSRSQIATSTGIPIELANSGKVDGVRYLSTMEGCKNKWSICETPLGLYFIDDYNHNINRLSGNGLEHLSRDKGFDLFMRKQDTNLNHTYYDNIFKDVYFVGGSQCLCFSEKLNEFMSFYPQYGEATGMYNYADKFLAFKNIGDGIYRYTKPYEMHIAKPYETQIVSVYNKFFDNTSTSSSITYRVAPEAGLDKIFTGVEFDSEMFDSREGDYAYHFEYPETFSRMYAKTDYQYGEMDLTKFPNLIRKFRKWRANMPRDYRFPMDRMRGPWLTLCLEKTWDTSTEDSADLYKKLEFHSLGVKYFV